MKKIALSHHHLLTSKNVPTQRELIHNELYTPAWVNSRYGSF